METSRMERNFTMVRLRQKGFTLIELMVVISIAVFLSGLVFANYKDSQKRYSLAQAIQRLAFDIRRAQNMAISGVEIAGVCSKDDPCYGYGIYAESKQGNNLSYKIFADKDNDQIFKEGFDLVVEVINLPSAVSIEFVSSTNGRLHIFFKPPDPTTYISGGSPGEITLWVTGSLLPAKKVVVSSSGLIEVKVVGEE